jgi:HEAT repeat protein
MVFISALARLQPEDPKYLAQVREQLANDRGHVRRSAADALVDLGNPVALAWLLERRGKEEMPSAIRAFDQSIEKLRGKERNVQQLQKELEQLRQQNRQLEERLKKLEEAASKR